MPQDEPVQPARRRELYQRYLNEPVEPGPFPDPVEEAYTRGCIDGLRALFGTVGAHGAEHVWRCWYEAMQYQGRDVAPERRSWQTLPEQEKLLDQRLAVTFIQWAIAQVAEPWDEVVSEHAVGVIANFIPPA